MCLSRRPSRTHHRSWEPLADLKVYAVEKDGTAYRSVAAATADEDAEEVALRSYMNLKGVSVEAAGSEAYVPARFSFVDAS